MYIIHHITLKSLYVRSFIVIKNPFFYTSENESGLNKNWGRSCIVADLPRGKICNERGKICNITNLPRSAMLRIFRGKACNVADLPGRRSARGEVCNTTIPVITIDRYMADFLLKLDLCDKNNLHVN